MSFPVPRPGLVIRYSYLWKSEARDGREEGSKDRPCAIVMALESANGRTKVIALPITHQAPKTRPEGLEIPLDVKRRLRLDFERSWVIVSEANVFAWPGPDLRPLPGQGLATIAYGFLPPGVFRVIREGYLAFARSGQLLVVDRTE